MITVGELKKGVTIELEGTLFSIVEYQHIKMGRGSAQVRLRLRNVREGHIVERSFQAGERFTRVWLDRRGVQYQYMDGHFYHFMDSESFDQIVMTAEQLGDAVPYLKEGMALDILKHGEEPIGVDLPITVDLQVMQTEPGFRGDTATGGTKPAVLETGLSVQVPLFVNPGEVVRVDTRTGTYLERVS